MDETQSELTKISTLPKRQRLQMDESFQMTSRTLDRSLTEISDVTDLSLSRPQRSLINNLNVNNDSILDDDEVAEEVTTTDHLIPTEKISLIFKRNTESDDGNFENFDEYSGQRLHQGNSKEDSNVTNTERRDMIAFLEEHAKADGSDISKIDLETDRYSLIVIDEATIGGKIFEETSEIDEMANEVTSISLLVTLMPPVIQNDLHDVSVVAPENEEVNNMLAESNIASRAILIDRLKEAILDKTELTEDNETLVSKLAEYLRRKRPDASKKIKQQLQDNETAIVDKEDKYNKYLLIIMNLQKKLESAIAQMEEINKENRTQIKELDKIINDSTVEFSKLRHNVGVTASHSNTGRRIPLQDLEMFYSLEKSKEAMVGIVRLDSIKLFNSVHRLQTNLYAQESLSKHLNLVDFEQLKIENQAYNGKLEEKTDSIIRHRAKIDCNVHITSHIKEKVQCIQKESQKEIEKQKEITMRLNTARRALTRLKAARDQILVLNKKVIKSGGLLGNNELLDHYQRSIDKIEIQRSRFEKMSCDYSLILKQTKKLSN